MIIPATPHTQETVIKDHETKRIGQLTAMAQL